MIALHNQTGGTKMGTKATKEAIQYWRQHVEILNQVG
jgi:hypothetical protein